MQQLDFYIGIPLTLVPPPDNWRNFTLELSYENGSPEGVLNENKLVWKGSNAAYMNQWFEAGNNGGAGVTEGIPLIVKICSTGEIAFNGVIDLTDPDAKFSCDIVTVRIRDRRMDMITQLFDSLSFAYLATPVNKGGAGIINPIPVYQGGDYVVIPYQINSVPDYVEFFSMGLAIYNIAEKVHQISDQLNNMITGTTIDFSTGQIGGTIIGILEIIGMFLYLVAMCVIMIDMLVAAFHYLVSPVYTKLGMYVTTMIDRVCQKWGLGFQSSIIQSAPFNRMVMMPAKSQWTSNETFTRELYNQFMSWNGVQNRMQYDDWYNLTHGGTAYGYWDGTPGDFMRALEDVFDAKMKIIFDSNGNPVLHFERWDKQYNLSQLTLPPISEQAPFKQPFKTNASELAANYMVRFAADSSDENTLHYYDGTSCYAMTRQVAFADPSQRNVLLMHLKERNLVFSHAFRKNKRTACEEVLAVLWGIAATIVNSILAVYNTIINIVNWVINLFCNSCPGLPNVPYMPALPQWAQTGHMLMTNHITENPKLFIAGKTVTNNWWGYQGVEVDQNNRSATQISLHAKMLMKYFHFSSLPISVAPGPPYTTQAAGTPYFNQWYIYDNQKIPLCCADWQTVENNNYITLADGTQAMATSVKWNIFEGDARIDYRARKQYTKNLTVLYVIDGAFTTQTL